MKVIIHAPPYCLPTAARAAAFVQKADYVWPKDNICVLDYDGQIVAIKRNKSSITVWWQS